MVVVSSSLIPLAKLTSIYPCDVSFCTPMTAPVPGLERFATGSFDVLFPKVMGWPLGPMNRISNLPLSSRKRRSGASSMTGALPRNRTLALPLRIWEKSAYILPSMTRRLFMKRNFPDANILPSVLSRSWTWPLKLSVLPRCVEEMEACAVIVNGEMKAARNPGTLGFALTALTWLTTCCLTCTSHASASTSAASPKDFDSRSSGSVIVGRPVKNSTPAVNSSSVIPVNTGSSTSGALTLIRTLRGPSSLRAKRTVNPFSRMVSFPSTPTKKTRSETGVVESSASMRFPAESILRMPPMSEPEISAPPKSPPTLTESDSSEVMGNFPCCSSPTSMVRPLTEPSNSRGTPGMSLTFAEIVSAKSAGLAWIFGQEIPRLVS